VLLVEDTPEHAELIREAFADANVSRRAGPSFEVKHVTLLTEALTCLRAGGIDVVLLDLYVPDSQGLETLTRTRAQAPGVPVVVLTALDDEALAVRAMREGAQDYVVKGEVPFELIARAVRYAIERQRAEVELVRARVAQAEAEAALRDAQLVEQRRREREQQELRSLERLSGPRPAAVTAQAFGVEPLNRALPETFRDLTDRYAQLLDLALEQRTYKVDHRLSDALRSLADEIGFLHAGPRDVVELHTAALKGRLAGASPQKAQAYVDEAHVMVLELMGDLVAYYRN
jgi:DNA-binding response OmpR family regulator